MSKCNLGFDSECTECRICPPKPEVPKLSKRERIVCELLKTGFIARDKFRNTVHYYNIEPNKDNYEQMWLNPKTTGLICEPLAWLGASFDFIQWKDEKPWRVEDLLKLEVRDE